MTKSVLNNLDVHTSFAHPCCECVAKVMTTEGREEDGIALATQQHFVIAISDDPLQCLVECPLMLCVPKAIHEDEVSVAINLSLAANSSLLLVLLFFKEGFSDEV